MPLDRDPNRDMLRRVAEHLARTRNPFMFLGGTTVGLLITDPAASRPRPTLDVDVVIHAASYADFQTRIRSLLLSAGLVEAAEPDAPACAWRLGAVRVDVMPDDASILGFTNRWYRSGLDAAEYHDLDGIAVAVIDGPHFIATKLEAFIDRGRRDCYSSHDLEDIIAVVDGRPGLVRELAAAPSQLREFVSKELRLLLSDANFRNALPGHLDDDQRFEVVWRRLVLMASDGSDSGTP